MRRHRWIAVVGLTAVALTVGLTSCSPTAPVVAAADGVQSISISNQQEGIWVSGEGRVSVAPDVAEVNLGIEVQDTSVAAAQSLAAEAMDRVMQALADSGVAAKDIQTRFFNIHQVTRWDRETEEETVTGYRVSNMVTAMVREIDTVGAVIDAVARAGGDFIRVNGISFSVDDLSEYEEQARELAMADAKARAEQLARLGDVRLGKPTYISESGRSVPTPFYAPAAPMFDMAEARTSISPGETEIAVHVQVVYDFLQ